MAHALSFRLQRCRAPSASGRRRFGVDASSYPRLGFPSATLRTTMGSAASAPILSPLAAEFGGSALEDVSCARALSRRPDPGSARRLGDKIYVEENVDRRR